MALNEEFRKRLCPEGGKVYDRNFGRAEWSDVLRRHVRHCQTCQKALDHIINIAVKNGTIVEGAHEQEG